LFFALAAGGLAADLITKSAIFERHFDPLDPTVSHWWIDGVLGIQTSFNGGALFGIFQGGSFWLAMLSLVALSAILIWMFAFKLAHSRFLTVALGLITGGILGNLYDRMGFGYVPRHPQETMYHVRDWIHFRLEGVPFFDPWPNFNIADSLLVTGAIMLFCYALLVPAHAPAEAETAENPAS
jgi:signal peptidase II